MPYRQTHINTTNIYLVKKMYLYQFLFIQAIRTDTYRYIQYIHILHDTYTYKHPAFSVGRGFSGAGAVTRDSTAQHYHLRRGLRSSQTGLGAELPSEKCVLTACGRRRGCTLTPPKRAARAGAPNLVRGGSLMAGKGGQAPAQGCPEWGPWCADPAEDLSGMLGGNLCSAGPIHTIHANIN